jgi:hypothetical protein
MKKLLGLLVLIVAVLGVRALPAQAPTYNAKTIPGSNCVVESTTPGTTVIYTDLGINVVTGSASVTCPLIRDDISNTNGLTLAQVAVNDQTTTGEISCRVEEVSLLTDAPSTSATAGSGVAAITTAGHLTQVQLFLTTSHSPGADSVHCDMPASTGIAGILYREVNPTTND